MFAALLRQLRREPHETLARTDAVIRISQEHGLAQTLAWAKAWRGWAVAKRGSADEGIEEIREGLAATRAIGTEVTRPQCFAMLAEVLTDCGRLGEAHDAIDEALAAVRQYRAGYYEAELYRLKAEVVLFPTRGHDGRGSAPLPAAQASLADAYLRQALDTARRQGARSFELRAAVTLRRFWRNGAPADEAWRALRRVYDTFTEGFDTADLREARALLGEAPPGDAPGASAPERAATTSGDAASTG
jgi:adenylate cyclase